MTALLPLLGGSLVAVLGVAALVHLLGLGTGARIDGSRHAVDLAEEALSGFRGSEAVVSVDGQAAVVLASNGTLAIIKRHGARFAVRQVAPPLQLRCDGDRVEIDSGERLFGRVVLVLAHADRDRLLTAV